jgi:elongation factor Ts
MAEITAGMVKELREKTDAPMMECKKALTEAGGDLEKAEEILRVKLGNKASKAAARVTAEGIVGLYLSADGKIAAMVEVNCETDFVAKNDEFLALVNGSAKLVAEQNPADVAALSALPMGEGTVESTRAALVGKIGENMTIRRFVRIRLRARLPVTYTAVPGSACSSMSWAEMRRWPRTSQCTLPHPSRSHSTVRASRAT